MIRSKFRFSSVYLSSFLILLLFSLGIFFLSDTRVLQNKVGSPNDVEFPGMILFLGSCLWFYVLFRKVTVITIENDRIILWGLFLRRVLEKNEIQVIDLWARESFFGASSKQDATTIYLKGEVKLSFPDSMYRNIPELKGAIQDGYRELLADAPVSHWKSSGKFADAGSMNIDGMERFSGNYFTSLNGILFYGICIAFVWVAISARPFHPHYFRLILVVPLLAVYLVLGGQLFYFGLAGEQLVIKNHLFFWYQRIYLLEDITGVVLESPYKRSNSLLIRTRDFKSKSYSAGSLRAKDWHALSERLENLGIPFKYEVKPIV